MLAYNEIKPEKVIVLDNQPQEVLTSDIAKRTKQKPVNQTKLRNLVTGAVTNVAFRQSDKVEEADMEKQPLEFAYQKGGEYWFTEPGNPSNRFQLDSETVGDVLDFVKVGEKTEALLFEDKIIALRPPIKVRLEVTQAPPNIKGNTSAGGVKPVTVETGLVVTTPLFIETGDLIEINTESGEYVTRVEKN